MSKKKKHPPHEEHMDESWLIPYADLLTLLLALFIVLFASSSLNAQKFKTMTDTFNAIFNGGAGIMENSSPTSQQQQTQQKVQNPSTTGATGVQTPEKSLVQIKEKIDNYITTHQLQNLLRTNLTSEGLLITITNDVLFNSGSATVRANEIPIAKEISNALVTNPPHSIIISGHTDDIPINTPQFPSNWELSSMRAINFMHILLQNPKLSPQNFSAKGYGQYRPIAPNDTTENRARNRRVEVLVVPSDTPMPSS